MRGGQYQVMLLLDGLRESGHDSVLLARENSPLWQAAASAGYHVARAGVRHVWSWSRRSAIVHAHDARAHTLAAIGSTKKFVVSRRVAFPAKRTVLSRWKYSRATAYLAISDYVANELRNAGVQPARIEIVHDGVAQQPIAEDWDPTFPVVALESADPGKMGALIAEAAALAGVEVVYSRDL